MSSLYELTGNFLEVQNMIEIDEFDREALENTLECIDFEIEIKAENYAKLIKNLKTVQAGIDGQKKALKMSLKDEIDRLDSKSKAIDNKINFLKENLRQAMKVMGKEKIKTNLFTIYPKKTQSVSVLDEKKALESEFVKTAVSLDKEALFKALKDGEKFDFADIKESETLIIR